MAAKMLDEVLEKEKSVAQAEADETAKANAVVNEAKAKAQQIIEDAEKNARSNAEKVINAANDSAQKAVAGATDEANKLCEILKEKADAGFSEAVGVVRNIIVG